MEWITTTAKTLPEAIDLALDNLGVDESEAEIVVVEEPKQGFFGRAKGVAKVEARVKPKPVRNKFDRNRKGGNNRNQNRSKSGNNRKKTSSQNNQSDNRNSNNKKQETSKPSSGKNRSRENSNKNSNRSKPRQNRNYLNDEELESRPVEEVAAYLKEYMSNLVAAFGFEDSVTVTGDEEVGLTVQVEGQHGLMVGQKGRTLNAIQELVRVSAQRSKPSRYRIYVDVGGYRQKRKEALIKFALEVAETVRQEDDEVVLDPMNSSDRKIIHDALTEEPGIETRSSGVEPRRRVVVIPSQVEAMASE